ncbi:hypothetical protein [Bacillus sp. KH172YL63]|uniref:hypothetical protein n=1 Tax=Bacillus sp. KH172YL63 TaxID=2709784 RepID=UPI0013E441D9|nr:hypothetical protein [Bacillus sp. KH172YL63]BCB02647.1 hypothetical protein KH172YL63_07800 [Bacillus sp. KH172YL63]
MKEGITFIVDIINNLHDMLIVLAADLGFTLTDKDLHFWIMGGIGISVFFFVYVISKILSKLRFGITALAFFYTLTFMFVLVFAIEIQQAITNRGQMEFIDAIIGLWGYIVFFFIYIGLAGVILVIKHAYQRIQGNREKTF